MNVEMTATCWPAALLSSVSQKRKAELYLRSPATHFVRITCESQYEYCIIRQVGIALGEDGLTARRLWLLHHRDMMRRCSGSVCATDSSLTETGSLTRRNMCTGTNEHQINEKERLFSFAICTHAAQAHTHPTNHTLSHY